MIDSLSEGLRCFISHSQVNEQKTTSLVHAVM